MRDATDAPREPTEVELESDDAVSAETPDSVVDGNPDSEEPDWEESERADDLERRAVPAHATEGGEVEKGGDPGASPVSELSERELRPVMSEESQGERPSRNQGKSKLEFAGGARSATRHLKANVSNESDPEAPSRKHAKTRERMRVDGATSPLRQRTASAPSLGRVLQTDVQKSENKISKCVAGEDDECAALLQKQKTALLQTELATVSLEEERQQKISALQKQLAEKVDAEDYAEAATIQAKLASIGRGLWKVRDANLELEEERRIKIAELRKRIAEKVAQEDYAEAAMVETELTILQEAMIPSVPGSKGQGPRCLEDVTDEDDECAVLLQEQKTALLQTELATVSLEEERQQKIAALQKQLAEKVDAEKLIEAAMVKAELAILQEAMITSVPGSKGQGPRCPEDVTQVSGIAQYFLRSEVADPSSIGR